MNTNSPEYKEDLKQRKREAALRCYYRAKGESIPLHTRGRSKGFKITQETKEKMRILFSGSNNPNWKGDKVGKAAGNARARVLYPNPPPCSCGKSSIRHHKDGNTLNNKPENIQFLCQECHMKEHYGRTMPFTKIQIDFKNGIRKSLVVSDQGRRLTKAEYAARVRAKKRGEYIEPIKDGRKKGYKTPIEFLEKISKDNSHMWLGDKAKPKSIQERERRVFRRLIKDGKLCMIKPYRKTDFNNRIDQLQI